MTGSVEHQCPICGSYEALCDHDARYENEGDLHGGAIRGFTHGIAITALITAVVSLALHAL